MCCPQTHVPEGYAARGEAPGAPAVHVLRDGGVGDGLGGGLQAGLAAQATAVAAEAVQLPPRGIVGSDAPGLGVEGVVIVDVIVVSVPRRTRRLWLTMRDEGGSKAVGCWLLPGFSPQDPPYGHIHVSLFPQKHVPQPSLPRSLSPVSHCTSTSSRQPTMLTACALTLPTLLPPVWSTLEVLKHHLISVPLLNEIAGATLSPS